MNEILSETVTRVIQDIVMEERGVSRERLTADARFAEDSDSLTDIEIIMAIESKLEITIPDAALDTNATMGDLYQVVATAMEVRDHATHGREAGRS